MKPIRRHQHRTGQARTASSGSGRACEVERTEGVKGTTMKLIKIFAIATVLVAAAIGQSNTAPGSRKSSSVADSDSGKSRQPRLPRRQTTRRSGKPACGNKNVRRATQSFARDQSAPKTSPGTVKSGTITPAAGCKDSNIQATRAGLIHGSATGEASYSRRSRPSLRTQLPASKDGSGCTWCAESPCRSGYKESCRAKYEATAENDYAKNDSHKESCGDQACQARESLRSCN